MPAKMSIRTLLLEYVDSQGASHISELHVEILNVRCEIPEHTIRARLSEAVAEGLLNRLGDGFYDVFAEDEAMTSVVSYPKRCTLFGDSRYRGNCDGGLIKNLILRYKATSVADPMEGSGTCRDVVNGINKYKRTQISYWGSDLKDGFDLTMESLPGRYDFVWLHPPYWNIIRYSGDSANDLSLCEDYRDFCGKLITCLKKCYDGLEDGGRMAVLVGDVRRKGRYYPLIRELLNLPFGQLRSIIIKVQHNCTSERREYGKLEDVPIKHEYCVVFKKPLAESII